MTVDTTRTITYARMNYTIKGIYYRILVCAVIALGFVFFPNDDPESYRTQLVGAGAFALLAGINIAILIHRVLIAKSDVIQIGPNGIQDERIAHATIPWAAIREILVSRLSGKPLVMLRIDTNWLRQVRQPAPARFMAKADDLLKMQGLCLNHTDFGVELDDFIETLRSYAKAYDAPAATDGRLPNRAAGRWAWQR
jgi:hypothetical protein